MHLLGKKGGKDTLMNPYCMSNQDQEGILLQFLVVQTGSHSTVHYAVTIE